MNSNKISFEKELQKLRDVGFTDEQVKAIWELLSKCIVETANRLLCRGRYL